MNWYIGQDIICVKTNLSKDLVKDKIYTIKGLRNGICKCANVLIDVGINASISSCDIHNVKIQGAWHKETLFAPLADISELEELLKEQPTEIQQ